MIIVISDLPHAREFGFSRNTTDLAKPDGPTATESYESLFIVPGSNFFERENEAKWKRIRQSPACKKAIDLLMDEGSLRETSSDVKLKAGKGGKAAKGKKGDEDSSDAPKSLAVFDSKMAIDIVRGTMDAENLKEWATNEDRANVRKEIKAQLEVIKGVDKARKEAQDAQG